MLSLFVQASQPPKSESSIHHPRLIAHKHNNNIIRPSHPYLRYSPFRPPSTVNTSPRLNCAVTLLPDFRNGFDAPSPQGIPSPGTIPAKGLSKKELSQLDLVTRARLAHSVAHKARHVKLNRCCACSSLRLDAHSVELDHPLAFHLPPPRNLGQLVHSFAPTYHERWRNPMADLETV